jgi:TorA maturation chaperone TorD
MSSNKELQEVLRILETLQPRQPRDDWLARLMSMNDADRWAVIERAVKRAVAELVRCIDDAVKSGAPNIYMMSCIEVLRLALEAEVSPVGPNGHDKFF